MDERTGSSTYYGVQPSAPTWKGSQTIPKLHRFNERCIELFGAASSLADLSPCPPAIRANRDLWVNLDRDGRRLVAQLPFVIVDVHFRSESWWRRSTSSEAVGPKSAQEWNAAETNTANGLSRVTSERLLQETIMFAWQMVNSDRTAGILSFGILAPVAQIIAGLTPQEICEISARNRSTVQIRWADDVEFWRHLLSAANAGDKGRLATLRLRAKLLFCGDLALTDSART
jgi:Flagellar transcriptional activator (FlhD)